MKRFNVPGLGELDLEELGTGAGNVRRYQLVSAPHVIIQTALDFPLPLVAPPSPMEPPPGAYQIGEFGCIRSAMIEDEPWAVPDLMYRAGRTYWRWPFLLEYLVREGLVGGPDVTIQRLVPEPRPQPFTPMDWTYTDPDRCILDVLEPVRRTQGQILRLSVDGSYVDLNKAACRTLGAYLTAAGEQP